MRAAAIITAAGSGTRMGMNINKVLLPLHDRTVVETAVLPFLQRDIFQKIVITHSPADGRKLREIFADYSLPIQFVEGGDSRQESVYRGLQALAEDDPETVLIHDAARPWVSEELVLAVLEKAEAEESAVPVIPSINAMKILDQEGRISEHLDREQIFSAQTPQGFCYRKILQAHEKAGTENYRAIDDTEIWDRYWGKVATVPGEPANIKITFKEDLKGI